MSKTTCISPTNNLRFTLQLVDLTLHAFQNNFFQKIPSGIPSVSNSLDSDQA